MPATSNGLAFARTPAEILALVFLGSPNSPGGFFPKDWSLPDKLLGTSKPSARMVPGTCSGAVDHGGPSVHIIGSWVDML